MGDVIAFPGDRARRAPADPPVPRGVTARSGAKIHGYLSGYTTMCGTTIEPRSVWTLPFDPADEDACQRCAARLRALG